MNKPRIVSLERCGPVWRWRIHYPRWPAFETWMQQHESAIIRAELIAIGLLALTAWLWGPRSLL